MDIEELAYLGIGKLKMRFENKIDYDKYYVSYSGGNDSELLRWFVKDYMKLDIPIVAVNTYREHNEIRKRMYENADVILYPTKSMEYIKENFGMPCFTKSQDEVIKRYQRGCRTEYLMNRIYGTDGSIFKLNKRARTMLLADELPNISCDCCLYTKKEPLLIYGEKTGLKPIIGVRGTEGKMRKSQYNTCLNKKGYFSPAYDLTNEMMVAIRTVYRLERLKIYGVLDRTGCIGCPYGKNTLTELQMVTPAQTIRSFGESYEVLGIEYNMLDLGMH